jgi:hypothetical protein
VIGRFSSGMLFRQLLSFEGGLKPDRPQFEHQSAPHTCESLLYNKVEVVCVWMQ